MADTMAPGNLPPFFKGNASLEIWERERRGEILDIFRNEVYGIIPDQESLEVSFRLADVRSSESIMGGNAVRKTVEISAERKGLRFSFPLVLFIPKDRSGPAPVILTLCNRGIKDADPARHFLSPFWPAETMVARGFAAAVLMTHDIAPDYDEGFTMGFHKLYPEYAQNRPGNAWGAISAWAWGLSKAIDYFRTDDSIDCSCIAVAGHSRGGKTALWCAAQDSRVSIAISSCSGCSGAAITRGKAGEHIRDITGRFPYWFCGNYRKYADNENSLPVDQHMLLALIAPRGIYVSSRTFDSWADPESEFAACVQASPVYKLYGKTGLPLSRMPAPEHPVSGGEIAYHLKTGGHDMDEYDWERYLDFCAKTAVLA